MSFETGIVRAEDGVRDKIKQVKIHHYAYIDFTLCFSFISLSKLT